jgi:hypothetical protein
MLALVAALASSPFIYRKVFFRVEEEVRARVEAKVAALFPHLVVQVRAAHLTGNGIEVRGLSIAEPGAPGPQPEIVYLDEVFLECRTNLQELIAGEPAITNARISRPILRATRRPDGTFSLSKLFPLPKPDHAIPLATIEDGMIVIFDPLKNPSSTFTLRDISLSIQPSDAANPEPGLLQVQGSLIGDHIHHIEVAGVIDPNDHHWTLNGTLDGLDISSELHGALPGQIADSLDVLKSLRARANLSFHIASDDPDQPPRFEINGGVVGGRLEDPLLPNPLTDLKATIHCDNDGFTISELTARDGATLWGFARFQRHGYEAGSPFVLEGNGKQVHVDAKWAGTLPEPWATDWKNYDPDGDVDLRFTVEYDGQDFKPTLQATCLNNVSFSCHKFPYRLDRCRGTLTLQNKVLDVAMTAFAGAQPVSLNGRFWNPGAHFTGWMEIQGNNIPFDEKLFTALLVKPKAHETLRALDPREGTFNFITKLWRDDPQAREWRQDAWITVNRCSITYDKFPYDLKNLQGVLELHDGQWATSPESELVGTNGTGIVKLQGTLATAPEQDVLDLKIHAENVPLQEDLRNALQASQQQLWDSLQPYGKIDLDAHVGYDSRTRKTTIGVQAHPRDDTTSIGTSIEPVSFPYRMRMLGGFIDYRDGRAELKDINAMHGHTHMHTRGSCDIRPDGSWQLSLRDLKIDRLRLQGDDHQLEAALPDALKRAVAELKPTGPINLQGALDFSKRSPQAPLHTGWNVQLYLNQGSLQVGPKLDNVFGRVTLMGTSDGPRYSSQGELDLDSLTYKNFQFTHVIGPLWFDNNYFVLGDWGPPPRAAEQQRRHVTATLLGGTLAGDCHVQLGAVPQYHLRATLAQADLAQFARENLTNHQRLNGKILANVELHGSRGPRNLFGSGTMHLSDADVYELPVMVSLLKIIRAKPPDSTAFTQSDIAFVIEQGEHILLKQIQLNGDAIDLSGQGELTLDGQTNPINLQLHTSVGRGNVPFLSSMLNGASQQILQIHVGGTLEHPVTQTQPFPAANQALQQLQGENDRPAPVRQTGGFFRNFGAQR